MDQPKVVITDYWYETIDAERATVEGFGARLCEFQCKTEAEAIAACRDADAVIVQFAPLTRRVIQAMERCRVIVRYAIGVDNIDLEAAAERGIYVCNVPDYGVDEVANHTVLLLLALARKLLQITASLRGGTWDYAAAKPLYRTAGQTVGLLGFGRIPQLVAKKLSGFEMELLCHDRYIDPAVPRSLGVTPVSLEELVERADYLSLHAPLNDETRHLFHYERFLRMKPTACLINTSRGGVIREADLVRALEEGLIAGAALDVFEQEPLDPASPLLRMDNVIATPHFAWYSEDSVRALQQMVADEVVRVLGGQPPKNPVNQPKGR